MKKGTRILLSITSLLLLALFFILIQNVNAADASQPAYPFGLNPEKIQDLPQTPEEAANVSSNYLKSEIGKLVAQIPGLLRTHEFLKAHPMFFTIVFNEPYNLSWVFFCIVLFWLYTMALVGDIANASRILKKGFGIIIGIGIALILAQLGIIKAVVIFLINLVFTQDLWWVRGIMGVLVILTFVAIGYGESVASSMIKKNKELQDKEMLKQEAREGKAFREGAEEAQEMTKEIREIKKKNPLM